MVAASLDDLWGWLEYIPHSGGLGTLDALRIEGIYILCAINNMDEVVLVVVIQGHVVPALALKYLREFQVAQAVNGTPANDTV